jgi:hypothetical protein
MSRWKKEKMMWSVKVGVESVYHCRWSKVQQLPPFMHEYIEDVIDVKDDEHCGFRIVVFLLGRPVDDQNIVRLDFTSELNKKWVIYFNVYGGKDKFDYIMNTLTPTAQAMALHLGRNE